MAPRRYDRALQLTAQKRFSNSLQFIASHVYSKLEGNYDGVFQTSTGQLDDPIGFAELNLGADVFNVFNQRRVLQ